MSPWETHLPKTVFPKLCDILPAGWGEGVTYGSNWWHPPYFSSYCTPCSSAAAATTTTAADAFPAADSLHQGLLLIATARGISGKESCGWSKEV